MKGILLVNLGSPDRPSTHYVKKYLGEFLMDKYVIDVPFLWRWLLVKGIIVNTRSKRSASAYKSIWTKEGSPLIVNTYKLADKLQEIMDCPIEVGMRYGSPSIKEGMDKLHLKGVTEMLLIPLYPQYAMSSTLTVLEKTKEVQQSFFPNMKINTLPAFYKEEKYLDVLAENMKVQIGDSINSYFVFSYHGLPERHIKKCDVTKSHCKIDGECCITPSPSHEFCYRHQCFRTTEELAKRLGLKAENCITSFQSRLGNDPWLKPYTNDTLVKLAEEGKTDLKVVSPAFVSDCLETLEEMEIENKEVYLKAGGGEYNFIRCLNDDTKWVDLLKVWGDNWLNNPMNTVYKELN